MPSSRSFLNPSTIEPRTVPVVLCGRHRLRRGRVGFLRRATYLRLMLIFLIWRLARPPNGAPPNGSPPNRCHPARHVDLVRRLLSGLSNGHAWSGTTHMSVTIVVLQANRSSDIHPTQTTVTNLIHHPRCLPRLKVHRHFQLCSLLQIYLVNCVLSTDPTTTPLVPTRGPFLLPRLNLTIFHSQCQQHHLFLGNTYRLSRTTACQCKRSFHVPILHSRHPRHLALTLT